MTDIKDQILTIGAVILLVALALIFQYYIGFVISILLTLLMKSIINDAPGAAGIMGLFIIPIIIGDILLNIFVPGYTLVAMAGIVLFFGSVLIDLVKGR